MIDSTRSFGALCLTLTLTLTLFATACGDDATQSTDPTSTSPGQDMGVADAATDAEVELDASVEPDMSAQVDVGADVGSEPDMMEEPDAGASPDMAMPTIAERCFPDRTTDYGPNYDQYAPTVGTHCLGTDHQNIISVEKVVFLGDSITVGTPPQTTAQFYRSLTADWLANRFALAAPNYQWRLYNSFDGTAVQMESGDFKSCSHR